MKKGKQYEPMLLSMAKISVRQKRPAVRTNWDEAVNVVSGLGRDRKSASNVPFRFR